MKGTILKLESSIEKGGKVQYQLPLGKERVDLNSLIGKEVTFTFTGDIYCIDSGKKIKKSYNSGYSYESFTKLAACDVCIVQPEKCHYHKGTCREPKWGEKQCMQPHYIYLSVTSGLKVGITRGPQLHTRWVDQGACFAKAIYKVKNRYAAGMVETIIKDSFADKTQWRKMLSQVPDEVDFDKEIEKIKKKYGKEIAVYEPEEVEEKSLSLQYPIEQYPEKVKSVSFDKQEEITGVLKGIKGQYLIFEDFVLNMRKHQGYEIELSS